MIARNRSNSIDEERSGDHRGSKGDDVVDEARRAALRKMGRYAAYTTPTILAVLSHQSASAAPRCSIAGPAGNPGRPRQCS
jgi:hypothetical protein